MEWNTLEVEAPSLHSTSVAAAVVLLLVQGPKDDCLCKELSPITEAAVLTIVNRMKMKAKLMMVTTVILLRGEAG